MPPTLPCYFDNNATTRIAPEVVEAMLPFLQERWGNPSSAYRFGKELSRDMTQAREKVAALIHADPQDVVFTSCGTESNNAAFASTLGLNPEKRHVVTTAVEHASNVAYAELLERQGYRVTRLPVAPDGLLDLPLLEEAICHDTALVSIMWANNETGVVFPVEEIAAICRSKGVVFHTDAVQAAGKLEIDVGGVEVDFLSLSAHKLHAPKGIGLLYINRRTAFDPYLLGGGQEQGRRGGTENVAGMVAFGCAAELALDLLQRDAPRIRAMRDRLEEGILSQISGTTRNGAIEPRLPNTASLAFEGVEAEGVLMALDQAGICASSGSACATGSLKPSHVLTAMGLDADRAKGSVRFSMGRYNHMEEVDYLLEKLPAIISRLRSMMPTGLADG